MLKVGVAWPTGDGIAAELDSFAQASHLEVTQHESTIGLKILWGNIAGAFEIMSGAGVVVGVESGLSTAEQLLDRRIPRLRPSDDANQSQ